MNLQLELMKMATDEKRPLFERSVCSDAALVVADAIKLSVTVEVCEKNLGHLKEELQHESHETLVGTDKH